MKVIILIIPLLFLISINLYGQDFVSLHLKSETFQKGKLATIESDYYFNNETGELVVHGKFPRNHIKISNRLGEVKTYFPDENLVSLKQNQLYSSDNELISYFLSNNYYDLGLASQGFTASDTRMDGKNRVVTWTSPPGLKQVAKVELVFEDDRPIYAAYFNVNGNIVRKIYYYNYQIFSGFILPTRVSQITYTSEKDSIIQRNTWSDIKLSAVANSLYFGYKIPGDAKVDR
jgi:hypothetical protein